MRPRPDAAENLVKVYKTGDAKLIASMRPRPDAAENRQLAEAAGLQPLASMRPRPDAAENRAGPPVDALLAARFNEAAARCRGKPAAGRAAR